MPSLMLLALTCFYLLATMAEGTLYDADSDTYSNELDRLLAEELQQQQQEVQQQHFPFSRMRRSGKIRLCGKLLVDTMNQVCNGCTKPVPNSLDEGSYDFRKKRSVHHAHSHRVKRGGLANECCAKMCTMEVLKTHCAPC
ncbi:unnamed protein product, partial [Mesorhabditis spiculigera]